MTIIGRAACAALGLGLACAPALAQDAAPFYAGKTISVYIGSDVGGGFNAYARTVGNHMVPHIAGKPSIVYLNMPGAGGRKATAYIANVAAKDGTAYGLTQPGAIVDPAFEDVKDARYDPRQFGFIGTPESSVSMCIARKDAAVKKFADAFHHELLLGTSARGSTTRNIAMALRNVLGVKFRLVAGYKGTREIIMAIERNEVQGVCGYGWSPLMSQAGHLVRDDKVNLLLQFALEGYPEPTKLGVPMVWEFVKTPEQREVFELIASSAVFGRPMFLPPGVPAARLAELRRAFDATMTDKTYLADAARQKLEHSPTSGERVQELVRRIFDASPELKARASDALYRE